MNLAPVIIGKMKKFASERNYTHIAEGALFEKFVNYHIAYFHQPNAFFGNSEIIDMLSMGGRDDTAIDGFFVKVNGHILAGIEDLEATISKDSRIDIEFVFIQAKLTPKTNMGDFNNFTSGIKNFLSEEPFLPHNDNIKNAIALKNKVLSDNYLEYWGSSPKVTAYYVNIGQGETQHTAGLANQLKKELNTLNIFETIDVIVLGERDFRNLCDANDDTFSTTFKFIQEMPLSEVENVNNSCIILCYADEFLKIVRFEDGTLRKTAFTDNVRDFQGMTSINKDIQNTIINTPEMFSLLNNGITVVCDSYLPKNRTLHIVNPQIVNGCQTSSVIHYCSDKSRLYDVPLVVKIIATSNDDVTNMIVRGTNRQNIVYDEAFEITRIFHKDLERYFSACDYHGLKIFYERRAKQFANNASVNQLQKFSFKNLIQASTALLLEMPHVAHRHESVLVKTINGTLFKDNHSMLAYFSACILYYELLYYFSIYVEQKKKYYTYQFHILFLMLKILNSENHPRLNDFKSVDVFYNTTLSKLHGNANKVILKAFSVFDRSFSDWVNVHNKSKYAVKDQQEFVDILVKTLGSQIANPKKPKTIGKVLLTRVDIKGNNYGFIETDKDRLFFHELSSGNIDWKEINGATVEYDLGRSLRGDPMAVDVRKIAFE